MYIDPVKQAEREIEELIALQQADKPVEEGGEQPQDTNQDVDPEKQAAEDEAKRQAEEAEKAKTKPTEDPNSETYKARWETLQGKYTSELGRANAEIRRLAQKVDELTQQISAGVKPAAPANIEAVLDTLEEEYGPKFTQAIDARIARLVKATVDESLKPVTQKVERYEQGQAETAQSTYETELTRLTPGWRIQNDDPEFISWLKTEKVGRRFLMELLADAHQGKDAAGVSDLFNAYTASKQPKNQPNDNPTKELPARPSPDALITPKVKGSDTTKIQDNKGRIIPVSEIDKFYKDVETGRIKDQKVITAREAEFQQAHLEGRITG